MFTQREKALLAFGASLGLVNEDRLNMCLRRVQPCTEKDLAKVVMSVGLGITGEMLARLNKEPEGYLHMEVEIGFLMDIIKSASEDDAPPDGVNDVLEAFKERVDH